MKKFFNVKTVSLVLAVILLVGGAVGGTLAWIVAETGTVTNTFTYGDINIGLTETDVDGDGNPETNTYKMVPGNKITKDPVVTVDANSEACWLFVKLEKSTDPKFDDFMSYEMVDDWNPLDGADGVYYQEVGATTADTKFPVIKYNTVTVKGSVTKDMLKNMSTNPTLKVTAYAVQKDNIDSAALAWQVAQDPDMDLPAANA